MENSWTTKINRHLKDLADSPSIENGLLVSREILQLMGVSGTFLDVDNIEMSKLRLPNAERYDAWFQPHPFFKSDRACFEIVDDQESLIQAKFYSLARRTKQVIAGCVHFTPNWEDADFTRTDSYKVGIDFFLTPDMRSLIVVLSDRGNLRLLELSERLNNTQVEIFTSWSNVSALGVQQSIHAVLWDSLKLKSVNEKFYVQISNAFVDLEQALVKGGKPEDDAKLFASRLLGRLLFCWFLRKKQLLNEAVGYFDVGDDDREYYFRKLEPLFFRTLNTPFSKRQLSDPISAASSISDDRTPYLNGGLFEAHENDWVSDSTLEFPSGFFDRLFEHFENFNFTTDESTPEYQQVAIDPEMLGRVFESLLAAQSGLTGTQARKAKGAFYTPREVVAYMCKESVRHYLRACDPTNRDYCHSIDRLLDTPDSVWARSGTNSRRDIVKSYKSVIVDALDRLKVIDPACGSGAFPMGMLSLLTRLYERVESRFDPYKTKLQIISSTLFGVDVEPMAIEISKLRAWLSLIIEEGQERVQPLPNLDFKFVCANSLVPLVEVQDDLFSDNDLQTKLSELRAAYFDTRIAREKMRLRDKFYQLTSTQESLGGESERTKQLKSFDPFVAREPARFFDPNLMFGEIDGFDITIGNPPYLKERDNKAVFDQVVNTSFGKKHQQGKMDYWYFFLHKAIDLTKDNGCIAFITSRYWLNSAGASKLIGRVSKELSFIKFVDLGKLKVFDAVSGHHMVAIYEKSARVSEFEYRLLIDDVAGIDSTVANGKVEVTQLLRENVFSSGKEIRISSHSTSLEGTVPLSRYFDVSQGLVQNPDKLNRRNALDLGLEPGSGVFVVTKDELARLELTPEEQQLCVPFFDEADYGRYHYDLKNHKWLLYLTKNTCPDIDQFPNLKRHLEPYRPIMDRRRETANGRLKWFHLHWPRDPRYFDSEKLVMPSMFSTCRATIAPAGTYFGLGSNLIVPREQAEISLLVLLAIINSSWARDWFYTCGKRRGVGVDIGVEKLRSFPLIVPSGPDGEQIEQLADKIVRISSGTADSAVRGSVDELSNDVDILIASLYENARVGV
jgi:type I restriction-modification system DNA methylase subunit